LNEYSKKFDFHSLVYDPLPLLKIDVGLKGHSALHSRRMGFVLGELIRDGASPERISYLKNVVQPKDTDDGEPVALAVHEDWQRRNNARFQHAGWQLAKATIEVDHPANSPSRGFWSGSPPKLVLCVHSADLSKLWGRAAAAETGWGAELTPRVFVYEQAEFVLGVYDGSGPFARCLGQYSLRADNGLPTQLKADPKHEISWSASLHWVPMHY
jgi:hypothetical protein